VHGHTFARLQQENARYKISKSLKLEEMQESIVYPLEKQKLKISTTLNVDRSAEQLALSLTLPMRIQNYICFGKQVSCFL
jgi:hypothetical protein